ncbi:MAG: sarcosine oxidase subunit alpha family protein [Betaproteobacteria bacterium]|nr:MAG: sarcosine oxidase subunit alpha family protein [Betaproteobacteria bacterium]
MTQSFRLAAGGIVDRSRRFAFEFDGTHYEGHPGDTLASALLANGVHFVARSFKYHRPRGIHGAGSEEPNALVQLSRGARTEPNVRATTAELFDGLVAASQNRWPSLAVDVGALNGALSRFLPAGFYYKTFMWPPTPKAWLRYEHFVRAAAGMGRAASESDPDRYEHHHAHCDVLVIGGGPAGLAAARAAAAKGARVVVCDEGPWWGGSLLGDDATIDGGRAAEWIAAVVQWLAAQPDVTLLARSTAFGCYDGNLVGLLERVTDHLPAPPAHLPRQRLWKIRAHAIVLASGAHERSIAYANNDLPGTLLAGAAATYVKRYGVRPGTRAVVFTNNDSAYATALALRAADVAIAAIVDARPESQLIGTLPQRARALGLPIVAESAITGAHGGKRVEAVDIAPLAGGAARRLDCDLVCVSGGWNPAVQLFSQARGTLRYDDALAAFVPESSRLPIQPVGAANGRFGLAAALSDGHAEGGAAAGGTAAAESVIAAPRTDAQRTGTLRVLWSVPARNRGDKRFVDLQDDVTAADIALAAREGYTSVEHLKRYTTLGMGPDQGKTSNMVGLALLAELTGRSIPDVGTTTFRPPYTPVTLGAFPGRECGAHVEPTRYSAMHDWHLEHGARFVNAGLWKRPHSYPRPGESPEDAANREAKNVRTNVGVVDVSTLGKIELQGKDAAEFLNRVYINRWDTLAVGRCRYGVMLREDGIVLDDGTTSRLAATHYLMTTTTANAVAVMQHLERLLQVDWPDLEVRVASVTEQWAAAAVSGPRARDVLVRLVDIDVSNAAFPFLAVAECQVRAAAGAIPARLFRMSYSGELAYEIHVPADSGRAMWDAVIAAGEPFGLMPYGTEAMSTLRIEKGHVVIGPEADGRTTADDLGIAKLVSPAKWCIGKPLLDRPALKTADRWQLVGLTAQDGAPMPRAAKVVADPDRALPNPMQGHVTSWCWSPNRDAWIALALVANGRARHGETLWAVSPLANARVRVKVGPPCFIDPDGERLRA